MIRCGADGATSGRGRCPRYYCLVLLSLALAGGCSRPAEHGWPGYVEGEFVYIAAPIGGELAALAVERGAQVARGDLLFSLDAQAEQAASAEAAARLTSARAQAANTDKGRRVDEIAVIDAQLEQAKSQAALAAAELARQQKLVGRGFVSTERLDAARTSAQQAQARVAELSASLRVARLPARTDERAAAEAGAAAAQFALEQSRWREQQKRQSAPADARVTDVFFRVGEWVNAGQPVMALLPPSATKARFFVPESELGRIALEQPVLIRCDGCDAPIAARISFIAAQAEYTPPIIYSNAQRARLVFMIEARPEPKDGTRLKPGQPIEVHRVQP